MLKPAHLILAASSCLLGVYEARAQAPLSTAFNFRGELATSGTGATDTYDIRFRLYDAASGGNQVGPTLCSDNLEIASGRFSLSLDFGSVFNAQQRYIEIEVREDAGLDCTDASGYTVLSPRQLLNAIPQATYSKSAATATAAETAEFATDASTLGGNPPSFYLNVANLTGALPTGSLSGLYSSPLTLNNALNVFSGSGAGLINLNASNISSGVLAAAQMPTNWAAGGDLTGFYPNPTIGADRVTLSNLDPDIRGVLSGLSSAAATTAYVDTIGWGTNTWGQATVPALPLGMTYLSISAGANHSLALRSDRTVVAWGNNFYGELNLPAMPSDMPYIAVSAGFFHSYGLLSTGQIIARGRANEGQLEVPPLPVGLSYTSVTAGPYYGFAMRSDGTLVAWGDNLYGQTDIPALPAGVTYTAVAAGYQQAMGLRSDGTVVVWGGNDSNQLTVPALPAGVTYTGIASGNYHCLALRSDGNVIAWGSNYNGEYYVPALPSGVTYVAVAAGDGLSGALRSDGTIVAWGRTNNGMTTVPALPAGTRYGSLVCRAQHFLANRTTSVPATLASSRGLSISGATVVTSSITANSFIGSGAGLTNLNATNLTTGTINVARLPSTLARTDLGNTFTAATNSFSGSLGIGTASPTNVLDVNGRLTVRGGVIQLGTTPVTGTSDLGLYSSLGSIRFVTNLAQFAWYSDGGASGAGTTPRMILTATGNLAVTGLLSKGGGSFKIDHPLDPTNKFLYHSFVESPDMMNIYNGVVTTGPDGMATVTLPDYFEALNRDFRYQLTVIDESSFALVRVSRRIEGNTFEITSSTPNVEISWEVTGVRKDAWAERNRIPTTVDKVGAEKGTYLHPEAFQKATSPSGAAD